MIEIDFTTKQKNTTDYVVLEDGRKCLYDEKGLLHSHNGLPAIICANGDKFWYKHGIKTVSLTDNWLLRIEKVDSYE